MDLLTLNDKNEQFIVEDEHAQCLEGVRCPAAHDKFVYEDYFEKGRFVMFLKN